MEINNRLNIENEKNNFFNNTLSVHLLDNSSP